MDTKSDDSAGSDSLDKSFPKKCVVDDVGQGDEGTTTTTPVTATAATAEAHSYSNKERNVTASLENSSKKQKTEKDDVDSGGGEGEGGGETVAAIAFENNTTATTKAQYAPAETPTTASEGSCVLLGLEKAHDVEGTACCAPLSSVKTNNSSNAFETKVTQISKNLQETTLAESVTGAQKPDKVTLEECSSTSSSSSAAASDDNDDAQDLVVKPSCSSASFASSCSSSALQSESGAPATGELHCNAAPGDSSIDDHRSKKVRFHPDVKENDGGNRVIPKRRKKQKTSHDSQDEAGASGCNQRAVDEMELDEEEDAELEEEEEEFDLAKTIAEAQDYLKSHPLTFTRKSYDKTKPPPAVASTSQGLRRRLLEEEDMPQLSESSEEETDDFYKNVLPENGVSRILGKQIKGGKVEFLLRYADQPGLHWATEDVIYKQCPTLLDKYEENRERSQDRLMHHIAKRQNLRQRYTDF